MSWEGTSLSTSVSLGGLQHRYSSPKYTRVDTYELDPIQLGQALPPSRLFPTPQLPVLMQCPLQRFPPLPLAPMGKQKSKTGPGKGKVEAHAGARDICQSIYQLLLQHITCHGTGTPCQGTAEVSPGNNQHDYSSTTATATLPFPTASTR